MPEKRQIVPAEIFSVILPRVIYAPQLQINASQS